MKVRIRVWRDDDGTVQPSRYVNEQTLAARGVHLPQMSDVQLRINIRPRGASAFRAGDAR